MRRWQKANDRFYAAHIQRDLFGSWSVIAVWGSTVTKLGNFKIHTFSTPEHAKRFVGEIEKKRLQRGYRCVSSVVVFGAPKAL